jgi:DNA-binding NarL/FixJ family response regulator
MPGKKGLETICDLRQLNPRARIIAMSGARPGSAYLQLALRFGAKRVLLKPFTQSQLIAAVEDVLAV